MPCELHPQREWLRSGSSDGKMAGCTHMSESLVNLTDPLSSSTAKAAGVGAMGRFALPSSRPASMMAGQLYWEVLDFPRSETLRSKVGHPLATYCGLVISMLVVFV